MPKWNKKRKQDFLNKRQAVRHQFRAFATSCPDLPSGKVHNLEGGVGCDPPDICIGNGELGIEFTDFFHGSEAPSGSAQKIVEDYFDDLLAQVKHQFLKQNNITLHVQPRWKSELPPKPQKQAIIQALVELIANNIPSMNYEHIQLYDFVGTGLEIYLDTISITRLPPPPQAYPGWSNGKGGQPIIGINDIKTQIREKESGLPRWKKVNSRWLVIVASDDRMASIVSPDSTVYPGCIEAQFDRVYLHDYWNRKLICLTEDKN